MQKVMTTAKAINQQEAYTQEKGALVCADLADIGNLQGAAEKAGVTPEIVQQWADEEPSFRHELTGAFSEAIKQHRRVIFALMQILGDNKEKLLQ